MTMIAPGPEDVRERTFPSRRAISFPPSDLDRQALGDLLDLADGFVALNRQKAKKLDLLKGRTLVNLFFEASTRTQSSFELAGKRLGADVVNMSPRASSISKGETLIDTAVTLNAMQPDILVVRHGASGAASLAVAEGHLQRDQRRRRPARAPVPGAARRAVDAPRVRPGRGADGGDLRRRAAQPRRPLQRRHADRRWARGCGWSGRRR